MIPSMTKKELAQIAGYTYRRLYDIDRDLPEGKKLFVPSKDGKYDLAIFVQKWVAYHTEMYTPDEEEDLSVVKARHERVKIQKTEIEVERLRGQLIDVQDIMRLWGGIANTVTQNMLHVSSKLAPMLQGQENIDIIRSLIDDEIRRVLEVISETPLPEYVADEEPESDEDED